MDSPGGLTVGLLGMGVRSMGCAKRLQFGASENRNATKRCKGAAGLAFIWLNRYAAKLYSQELK